MNLEREDILNPLRKPCPICGKGDVSLSLVDNRYFYICNNCEEEFTTTVSDTMSDEILEQENVLTTFIRRMKKLNINIELFANYPWIYIDKINGKKVIEKLEANHGFTIAFTPVKVRQKMEFTDLKEIFKLIRKYR